MLLGVQEPDVTNSVLSTFRVIAVVLKYCVHLLMSDCKPARVWLRRMMSSAYATIPVKVPYRDVPSVVDASTVLSNSSVYEL